MRLNAKAFIVLTAVAAVAFALFLPKAEASITQPQAESPPWTVSQTSGFVSDRSQIEQFKAAHSCKAESPADFGLPCCEHDHHDVYGQESVIDLNPVCNVHTSSVVGAFAFGCTDCATLSTPGVSSSPDKAEAISEAPGMLQGGGDPGTSPWTAQSGGHPGVRPRASQAGGNPGDFPALYDPANNPMSFILEAGFRGSFLVERQNFVTGEHYLNEDIARLLPQMFDLEDYEDLSAEKRECLLFSTVRLEDSPCPEGLYSILGARATVSTGPNCTGCSGIVDFVMFDTTDRPWQFITRETYLGAFDCEDSDSFDIPCPYNPSQVYGTAEYGCDICTESE